MYERINTEQWYTKPYFKSRQCRQSSPPETAFCVEGER